MQGLVPTDQHRCKHIPMHLYMMDLRFRFLHLLLLFGEANSQIFRALTSKPPSMKTRCFSTIQCGKLLVDPVVGNGHLTVRRVWESKAARERLAPLSGRAGPGKSVVSKTSLNKRLGDNLYLFYCYVLLLSDDTLMHRVLKILEIWHIWSGFLEEKWQAFF